MALAGTSAQAASLVDLHSQNVARINSQYKLASAGIGAPTQATSRHAEMLGLDSESSLSVLTTNKDKDGTNHYRYQQSFRGLPIWNHQVIVSEDAHGNIKHLFGDMVNGLAREIPAGGHAVVTKAGALAAAKSATLGNRAVSMRVQREDVHPVIFLTEDKQARAHLAYYVSFFAETLSNTGKPTRPVVIIDAVTGKVLKQFENLQTSLIGTGPGGNGKTGQYEWGSGGLYGFMDVSQSGTTCTMNNANVRGVNLNGGTTGTTAYTYTCPRNTYKTVNGGFSPINDAFQFGGVITNMYPAYTTYNALTFQLIMRVHYKTSYENAFWDGTEMSFGDGATTFYPLVNADVSGHEVSHGFTEQHSGLTYSGQSGGINESFSDMGGEATEFYWKGSNDFLVGAEIFKGSGALRYMSNPPQDGGSIDNAANYTSSMDVHYTSGVYNKAFWKLATTAGWTTPKAFGVFARANALYWTSSTTYNSGACGVETAATDLGYTKADVTAAFTLVGVSCSGGGGGDSVGGPLTKGTAITGIHVGTAGNSVTYTLSVPAGATNLTFNTSGGTGDMDMYVKAGSAPTDTVYDCRPYTSGNTESCTIASPVAGTYYVRLKAYAAFTGVSLTGDYTAGGSNTAPTANWSASTSGLTATFTDSSTDPQGNGTITGHSWNFGDGSTSTTTSPSHTYAAAGTYSVSETVTDSGGLSNTKTASVTVGGSCGGTVLCSGTAVALASQATGTTSPNYTMPVLAGHTVTFTISGGTGDADLYVRAGAAPTTSTYSCRPYTTGNSETCTFTPSANTTYYVNVRAYAAYSGVSLKGTSN